jgi:hypothetical protein
LQEFPELSAEKFYGDIHRRLRPQAIRGHSICTLRIRYSRRREINAHQTLINLDEINPFLQDGVLHFALVARLPYEDHDEQQVVFYEMYGDGLILVWDEGDEGIIREIGYLLPIRDFVLELPSCGPIAIISASGVTA